MLRQERPRKIHEIRNHAIVRIRPERRKFKTVPRPRTLGSGPSRRVLHRIETRRIGIIFRIRAVGDDKDLYILK